jgi:hypothetical protein
MAAPAACLDECMHIDLVEALWRRGFSVASMQIAGPRGVDDDAVLARATELGRVLVTHNVQHFTAVHAAFEQQGRAHGGIVCLPQTRPFWRIELRAAMMLDWLGTQPYASRLFVWDALQQQLGRGVWLQGYDGLEVLQAFGRA